MALMHRALGSTHNTELVAYHNAQEVGIGALEFKIILSYITSWRLAWDIKGSDTHPHTYTHAHAHTYAHTCLLAHTLKRWLSG